MYFVVTGATVAVDVAVEGDEREATLRVGSIVSIGSLK